ncbi:hypothetical protein OFAG_02369 [Oxalobacter formigenes HOxBLS]|uniref:Uncharacterized protein n=1 Tax=Oxalobacter paraformigenes TaxID=556268 RepID=T5LQW1_9BURK|nr:hypothetical protein OFAG_02369 [Oxalobacter paraformigenes]
MAFLATLLKPGDRKTPADKKGNASAFFAPSDKKRTGIPEPETGPFLRPEDKCGDILAAIETVTRRISPVTR